MQPTQSATQIPSDVTTLSDWIRGQFAPTDPIEVQNILPGDYHFKYCVNEDIEIPDEFTKRVANREYEEKDLAPGESIVLMGGAAYIFVDGVARAYAVHKHGDSAAGDLAKLVEAAAMSIIGKVGFSRSGATPSTLPRNPSVNKTRTEPVNAQDGHNPNTLPQTQDDGIQPPQQPPTDETAFDGLDDDNTNPPVSEFDLGDDHYDTVTKGNGVRYRKNNQFVKQEVFEQARAEYLNASQSN